MMGESIYNLVPVEIVEPVKPPMYRSLHDPKVGVTGSTFGTFGSTQILGAGSLKKKESSLFGKPPMANMPDPKKFLKCREKLLEGQGKGHFAYGDAKKDAVPRRDDRPVMGLCTSKNFITANAVEAILAVPRSDKPPEPDYLQKVDYGKTPAYLDVVKQEIQRENDMIEAYVKDQMGYTNSDDLSLTEELDIDERNDLIDALKTKWDFVNAKYQQITHNVTLDTVGKITRKETMEKQLKALEADISKLEKPYPIYIKQQSQHHNDNN